MAEMTIDGKVSYHNNLITQLSSCCHNTVGGNSNRILFKCTMLWGIHKIHTKKQKQTCSDPPKSLDMFYVFLAFKVLIENIINVRIIDVKL